MRYAGRSDGGFKNQQSQRLSHQTQPQQAKPWSKQNQVRYSKPPSPTQNQNCASELKILFDRIDKLISVHSEKNPSANHQQENQRSERSMKKTFRLREPMDAQSSQETTSRQPSSSYRSSITEDGLYNMMRVRLPLLFVLTI